MKSIRIALRLKNIDSLIYGGEFPLDLKKTTKWKKNRFLD